MYKLFDVVKSDAIATVAPGTTPEGVAMLKAPKVWADGVKGEGVVVGVIDTGVDYNHPDLKGRVIGGVNFTTDYGSNQSEYMDNHGHGTHCSGTVLGDGTGGVLGMAPAAKLLGIKVLAGNGSGTDSAVAKGINYLVDFKLQNPTLMVIGSLSLGGPTPNPEVEAALKRAVANNVPLICAAGNEGQNTIGYPAYYQDAISVGALLFDGSPAWWFSSSNDQVDVAAPGVDILSCKAGGGYQRMTGTSMATPHVAGFAALVACHFKKRHLRWPTEAELYGLMKYLTTDVLLGDGSTTTGVDKFTGAGMVSFAPHDRKKTVKYFIGKAYKLVNGVQVALPVAPSIDGTTSVGPVRSMTEDDAGAKLTWNNDERSITLEFEV